MNRRLYWVGLRTGSLLGNSQPAIHSHVNLSWLQQNKKCYKIRHFIWHTSAFKKKMFSFIRNTFVHLIRKCLHQGLKLFNVLLSFFFYSWSTYFGQVIHSKFRWHRKSSTGWSISSKRLNGQPWQFRSLRLEEMSLRRSKC